MVLSRAEIKKQAWRECASARSQSVGHRAACTAIVLLYCVVSIGQQVQYIARMYEWYIVRCFNAGFVPGRRSGLHHIRPTEKKNDKTHNRAIDILEYIKECACWKRKMFIDSRRPVVAIEKKTTSYMHSSFSISEQSENCEGQKYSAQTSTCLKNFWSGKDLRGN